MKMHAVAVLLACAAAIANAADRAEAIRKPEEPSAAPAPESLRSAFPREGMTALVLPEVATDAKRALFTQPVRIRLTGRPRIRVAGQAALVLMGFLDPKVLRHGLGTVVKQNKVCLGVGIAAEPG